MQVATGSGLQGNPLANMPFPMLRVMFVEDRISGSNDHPKKKA